jgi:hypothetical protein
MSINILILLRINIKWNTICTISIQSSKLMYYRLTIYIYINFISLVEFERNIIRQLVL